MKPTPVIVIFDVGKTNKKLFLFDESYKIVYEKSARFLETVDEDGFPCENQESLRLSIFDSLNEVFKLDQFDIKAVNFSTYGASFVLVDEGGEPLAPLYNYLKPYPEELNKKFYAAYGDETVFASATASPVLGNLNSGLQLYRIKHQQPDVFKKLKYALHLPQYLSALITKQYYSDLTSIGCHTALWNFDTNQYHNWVQKEGIAQKLPPLKPSSQTVSITFQNKQIAVGVGLHDSSAALIPYLVSFTEPFILLSTGTWCISMNPFNHSPLTSAELQNDCLCYLQYQGKPVKASRLFAGHEHEQQVKRIAGHFKQDIIKYRTIPFNAAIITQLKQTNTQPYIANFLKETPFKQRDLSTFKNDAEAYHQLILDLVYQQVASTQLVLKGTAVKRIFVDGGFSHNAVYMNLLAMLFPGMEIFAASMAQATAIGAALAIHHSWNTKPLPGDIIELKHYSPTKAILI